MSEGVRVLSKISPELIDSLMQEALREAARAAEIGEVPVGAVLAVDGAVVSRAHNLTISKMDPSAHAEVIVLREAASKLGDWRLNNALLVVTLEPCSMCAGAIKLARVPTVVFGAFDARAGAVGSLYDLLQDERSGPPPRVITGVRAGESAELLSTFFRNRRTL